MQAGSAGLPTENCPVLSSAQHLQQGESRGSESGRRTHRVWGESNHTEQNMAVAPTGLRLEWMHLVILELIFFIPLHYGWANPSVEDHDEAWESGIKGHAD